MGHRAERTGRKNRKDEAFRKIKQRRHEQIYQLEKKEKTERKGNTAEALSVESSLYWVTYLYQLNNNYALIIISIIIIMP